MLLDLDLFFLVSRDTRSGTDIEIWSRRASWQLDQTPKSLEAETTYSSLIQTSAHCLRFRCLVAVYGGDCYLNFPFIFFSRLATEEGKFGNIQLAAFSLNLRNLLHQPICCAIGKTSRCQTKLDQDLNNLCRRIIQSSWCLLVLCTIFVFYWIIFPESWKELAYSNTVMSTTKCDIIS